MWLEIGWIETTYIVSVSTSNAYYLQIMTEEPKGCGLFL